jgi:hypothetical protein
VFVTVVGLTVSVYDDPTMVVVEIVPDIAFVPLSSGVGDEIADEPLRFVAF